MVVRERHERAVAAPPERVLAEALAMPAAPDRMVRLLFRLRGLGRGDQPLPEFFAPPHWRVLEWSPRDFAAASVGLPVRIEFELRARPTVTGSVLATETRVQAHGVGATVGFGAYWLVVRPFSGFIRRRWLIAAAKRSAAPSPNAR
jgi:hypothetical protein